MANHSLPQTTSPYADFVTELDGRFDDLALMLSSANTTPTNLPANSIRWNTGGKWEILVNGTSWQDLSSAYAININGTVGATTPASGTFTNLVVSTAASLPSNSTVNSVAIVTLSASQTLTNKTLSAPVISSISNTGTITLPTSTDTLVGRATTDTLTNKTLSTGSIWNGGTIGVTVGGTGTTTSPTQGGVIFGSSTTAYGSTAAGTAGQFLTSQGTSAPTWSSFDTVTSAPDAPFKKTVRLATTADLGASTFSANVLTGYSNTLSLNVTTTLNSTTATVATTTAGIKVGSVISGNANIPAATVTQIVNSTTFIMSAQATAAAAGVSTTFTNTIAALSVDGVAVVLNDRILVKDQSTLGGLVDTTAGKYNGIYVVSAIGSASVPWTLTRATDADSVGDLDGCYVTVASGTANATNFYTNKLTASGTLNTTPIYWRKNIDISDSIGLLPTATTGVAFDLSLPNRTVNFVTGNVADLRVNSFGITTLNSPAAASTYTAASTLYVAGAPAAGTNATVTNAYAMYVAAGNSYFGGNVGVGVTGTPASKLEVVDTTNSIVTARGAAGYGAFYAKGSGTNSAYLFLGNITTGENARLTAQDTGILSFSTGTGATERLRIDNSTVTIGPSAATRVIINGTSTSSAVTNISNFGATQINGSISGSGVIAITNQAGGGGGSAIGFGRGSSWDTYLAFYTNPVTTTTAGATTEVMRLDSSGNLGLGVTPSAWSSTFKSIQAGIGSGFTGYAGADPDTYVTSNAYYNGGWKYVTAASKPAYLYEMQSGVGHKWFTAPSGTAGTAITFTQAMTLSASGKLGIGETSPVDILTVKNSSTAKSTGFIGVAAGSPADLDAQELSAWSATAGTSGLTFAAGDPRLITMTITPTNEVGLRANKLASNATDYINFYTAGSERLRINSSGNIGIGTTSNAPQSRMEIRQATSGSTVAALTLSNYVANAVNTGVALYFDPNGAGSLARAASIRSVQTTSGNYADLEFYTANSDVPAERMRITPGGVVVIGGNTGALESYGRTTVSIYDASAGGLLEVGGPSSGHGIVYWDTGGSGALVVQGRSTNAGLALAAVGTGEIVFRTVSNNERARLTSAGNFGLGVTPNTTTAVHLQLPAASALGSKGDNLSITSNAYYNSAWKYSATAAATHYLQTGGIHYWYTAASGTADANITFTEKARVSSSGLQVSGAAHTPPVVVTFSATAMTLNCQLSNVFTTTFTANVTTAPSVTNPQDGQTINWFITQDATGTRTMTWPTSFKWPGGTAGVLSTAANSVDLLVATYRSATGFWYATLSKGFA